MVSGVAAGGEQLPQISYIYPAGGRQGTAVEITVGGQNLGRTTEVYITGSGVAPAIIRYAKPLSRSQMQATMKKLEEVGKFQSRGAKAAEEGSMSQAGTLGLLAAKATEDFEMTASYLGIDDTSPSGFAEFRRMIDSPKRQPNAQIAEIVVLRLTIDPQAELGERQLRLRTAAGITNPLFFHVGQYREYREKEPNDQTPDGGALTGQLDGVDLPDLESLPVVLNGQIMPGDVDRFRIRINKGTRLVAAVGARALVPFLADAVPGWFQPTLALFGPKGKEAAYADDFRFHPDPVITYEVPETGDYVLEIHDSIYRGREDFVYRIVVGEIPFVTDVFPLGGRAGARTPVELKGWNLPVTKLTLNAEGKPPGILDVRPSLFARPYPSFVIRPSPFPILFALDNLPECLETEPNDDARSAQQLKLPMIVNGRIDRPGDWDVFRFEGRAGDEIVAEVLARRLGSPLDSILKLTDANGKQLAANDDYEDKGAGLVTHHADSYLCLKLPADGAYRVHLGDMQHQGGAPFAYRLRIGPARPDFDLRVAPCSLNARAATNVPIAVYAVRRDGFAGEILLRLKDPPRGFALGGALVPTGQDQVRLTLAIPPGGQNTPIRLRLEGRALINGAEVTREAVPAEDMIQAFVIHHLLPTEQWLVTASGSGGGDLPLQLLGERPARLPAGGIGRVPVSVAKGTPPQEVRLELSEPPKGIALSTPQVIPPALRVPFGIWRLEFAAPTKECGLLVCADPKEAKPGLRGNLILNAFLETPIKDKNGKDAGTRRTPLGTLPALPFEIVGTPPAADASARPASK